MVYAAGSNDLETGGTVFSNPRYGVLPIGSIENHGSHLALGTDFSVRLKLPSSLTGKVTC